MILDFVRGVIRYNFAEVIRHPGADCLSSVFSVRDDGGQRQVPRQKRGALPAALRNHFTNLSAAEK